MNAAAERFDAASPGTEVHAATGADRAAGAPARGRRSVPGSCTILPANRQAATARNSAIPRRVAGVLITGDRSHGAEPSTTPHDSRGFDDAGERVRHPIAVLVALALGVLLAIGLGTRIGLGSTRPTPSAPAVDGGAD